MKPLKLDAYKMLPAIGQELTKFWIEKDPKTQKKIKKFQSGFILKRIYYYKTKYTIELRADIWSPNSEKTGTTLYQYLCRDFTWLGDHFEPIFYEAK